LSAVRTADPKLNEEFKIKTFGGAIGEADREEEERQ
jgi:hypothetical protein